MFAKLDISSRNELHHALPADLTAAWRATSRVPGVGASFSNSLSLPGTQSQRAVDLLQREFPAQAGDQDEIVFAVPHGSVTSSSARERIQPVLASVARLPHVAAVVSPYSPRGAHQIAADGTVAFATVIFDEQARTVPHEAVNRVIATAEHAAAPSLQVALGGQAIELVERPSLGAAPRSACSPRS